LADPILSANPAERVYAERAARLLCDRYRERVTVSEVAAALQLSEGYTHRLFKACYGMGPIEYLNRYRVEVAVEEIKKHHLALAEAARRVGIEDVSYMSRLFKRVKGVSAREYFREEEVKDERLPYPPLGEKK
jgi:AraC-like DNA-binding protein